MEPVFFKDQHEFRKWLEKNHQSETEVLVGFYKVGSGKANMSWSESVDQALCFGWIDGVRKSIDGESYTIRFTPRKEKSIWSAVNIKKIEELTSQGRMSAAGLAIYVKREEHRSRIYSFENEVVPLSKDYEARLKANAKAWKFFQALSPYYRKRFQHGIMSAKQEATRVKRLEELIRKCEAGEKL